LSRITTLILVVVLVVLGAALYFGEVRPSSLPKPTPTSSVRYLFDLQPDDITAIRVQDDQTNMSAAIRRVVTQTWEVTEPFHLPADSPRAQGLANQTARLIIVSTITQSVQLDKFGLVAPSHTITVTTANGEHTIKVGDKSFDKSDYYVLRDSDSTVYLVPATAIDELKKMISSPLVPPTATPTRTPTPVVGPASPTLTGTPMPTATPAATAGP